MKKTVMFVLFLVLTTFSFSEVKVSVFENMRFENMNSRNLKRSIVGKGILEIQADEEDFGKIIELTFVEKSLMTNGKNAVLIRKITIDDKYKKFVLNSKITHIEFTAVLNQRRIKQENKDAEIVEGDYVGGIPIMISIYKGDSSAGSSSSENIVGDKAVR